MTSQDSQVPPQNPYAAPEYEPGRVAVDAASNDLTTLTDEDAFYAVVGRNAAYYLRKWEQPRQPRGPTADVNWAAFFFCGWWLAYRRMYTRALIYYGIIVAVVALTSFLWFLAGTNIPRQPIHYAIALAAACICGKRGNVWYRSHIARIIEETPPELGRTTRLELLNRRGGTRLVAALLCIPFSFFACLSGNLMALFLFELVTIFARDS
jgi:hypothetical protein